MRVIGVTTPNLKLVFTTLKQHTKAFETQDKLRFIEKLVDTNVFEMQQIAYEYFNSDKNLYKSVTLEYIQRISKQLDNWVLVDVFGTNILGCAWRDNIVSTSTIKRYVNSKNVWKRRLAVVSTIALNQKSKGGLGDSKRTLDICKLVVEDHQDMVVKALSWALRELAKVGKAPVIQFIDTNANRLHKKVLRDVNNKLETGRKL